MEDIRALLEDAKKTGEFQGMVMQSLRDIKEIAEKNNREMYARLSSIEGKLDEKVNRSELGKIEEFLKGLSEKMEKKVDAETYKAAIGTMQEDVKILMNWRYYILGIVAACTFMANLIF